jgi:alpha-galactosidase
MNQTSAVQPEEPSSAEIVAVGVSRDIALNAEHASPEWSSAQPVTFNWDWQGKNPAPDRETAVRVLWSPTTLYLRFECHYRELHLFSDSEPNGRRYGLWDRDVAEAFLQPDPAHPQLYKELEVSPNAMWVDLDIAPGQKLNLNSGLTRSVYLDEQAHTWSAELAIPLRSLIADFDSGRRWRVNFFRVEGKEEPRGYYAWRPTHTPKPNFHVPSAFGSMRFEPSR